jgi:UDP-N-acetylglucosamine 3-dehydrogenase
MIKVGVVGAGSMGQHHIRNYSEMKDVELSGIFDTDKERANRLAEDYNTRAFTNYNDLLDNVAAVSIAVPTTFHKKVALDAIEKGVHVLIEKPIADNVKNADEIIKRAKKKNVNLMVGHIERFNPAILELKKIIDRGELGNIVSLSTTRVGPFNPRIRDVGVILDIGVHDIDVISYLYAEKVTSVYASSGNANHNLEDHAAFMLGFGNGHVGIVKTNWLTPHKVRKLIATGTKGIAYVDYLQSTLQICDSEWVRDKKIEKKEPLRSELEHFISCIKEDKNPLVGGEEGKHALEVALACVESCKRGEIVKIGKTFIST